MEGVLRVSFFLYIYNDRVPGQLDPVFQCDGSIAGHGQLCLWALCSLAEQRCSTGGDSQAYQVKKKCLATEGFSCWVRVCVCVCVCECISVCVCVCGG